MSTVVFRPDAEADLASIAVIIAEQSVSRARKVIGSLRARTRILERHPEAGRPRSELGEGLRSLVQSPYVLIYRILDASTVEIVAILHGARDLPSALAARLKSDQGSE